MAKRQFIPPDCQECPVRDMPVIKALRAPEEIDALSAHKGCQVLQKRDVIFREGSYPIGMYVVYEGKVKVYRSDTNNDEHIVRMAGEGEVLGYRALLSGQPYEASAAAIEDAVVCFLPRDLFLKFLQTNRAFSEQLVELLCHDLGMAEQQLVSLAHKSVKERLAEALLMLKERYGLEEDNETLKIDLTRRELASLVSTSTETVIRLLSELNQRNIVDLSEKKIRLLNVSKLIEIAKLQD